MLAAFALLLAGCAGSAQQGITSSGSSAPQASPPSAAAGGAQQAQTPPAANTTAPPPAVSPPPGNNTTATAPSGGNGSAISLAQLALHNTEADCWVGYGGNVYDITGYLPYHKNYQMLIVPLCGTADRFQAQFEAKHGTSKVNMLESQPLVGALGQ